MRETIAAISNFVRALASLTVVSLIGVGGWLGYQTFNERHLLDAELKEKESRIAEQDMHINRLSTEVVEKNKKIQQLDMAVRLLKVDHRLAEMVVVEQWKSDVTGKDMTKVSLVEVDSDGKPLGEPKLYSVEGDIVYVDGLIVKYQDKYVEEGDPLRGTSAFLFRRLYGEHQEPADGTPIDPVGGQPERYGGGTKLTDIEKDIWINFWEYANNPVKRDQAGIRAAHGEAKYIKVQKGKLYKIQLRASDGVSIVAEDLKPMAKPL